MAVIKPAPSKSSNNLGASSLVALGILISRVTGLLRETLVAHYFGSSFVADAWRGAFRIPNLLSNLFGEGVLSASFITVYAKLRASGEDREAEYIAKVVFGLLSVACSVLVLVGVLCAPLLTDLIVPGWSDDRRTLAITIVRILFPGTGFMVMSAWCLGVLNSHRSFLLPYVAPVATNFAMIAALFLFSRQAQQQLVLDLAWAFVVGSFLQFLLQMPKALQYIPHFRPVLEVRSKYVRSVFRSFGPIFLSRGVVQISAFVDQVIASWLPLGSVAHLGYAQIISVLPVSLFGMSVSAAELPELSSATGTPDEIATVLRRRLISGLRRIAFFIIPSAAAFLLLGDTVAGAVYQSGKFTQTDAVYVWAVLAGSAVGLLATSLGRLYSSAFYALLDTRTPLRFAVIRILLTTLLGFVSALALPRWLGIDEHWGTTGLTASAGVAGWVEFILLRRALNQRIGQTGIPGKFAAKLWSVALVSACVGYACKPLISSSHPLLRAELVLPLFGALYFGGTMLLNVEESRNTVFAVLRRVRRS